MICPLGHETIFGELATDEDRAAPCGECTAGAPPVVREETAVEKQRRLRGERAAALQASDTERANALVEQLLGRQPPIDATGCQNEPPLRVDPA